MLNFAEKKVLETIKEKLLISKGELSHSLGKEAANGFETALERLKGLGYIDTVGGLTTTIVITQKGLRILEK